MDNRYNSAGAAANRMMQAQERFEAARQTAWAKCSWLSKMLWILFNESRRRDDDEHDDTDVY